METHDFVEFLGFKILGKSLEFLGFRVLYLHTGSDDVEVTGEFYETTHVRARPELWNAQKAVFLSDTTSPRFSLPLCLEIFYIYLYG